MLARTALGFYWLTAWPPLPAPLCVDPGPGPYLEFNSPIAPGRSERLHGFTLGRVNCLLWTPEHETPMGYLSLLTLYDHEYIPRTAEKRLEHLLTSASPDFQTIARSLQGVGSDHTASLVQHTVAFVQAMEVRPPLNGGPAARLGLHVVTEQLGIHCVLVHPLLAAQQPTAPDLCAKIETYWRQIMQFAPLNATGYHRWDPALPEGPRKRIRACQEDKTCPGCGRVSLCCAVHLDETHRDRLCIGCRRARTHQAPTPAR